MRKLISRDGVIPIYIQIKNILKEEIQNGVYNLTLPPERTLAEKYHVNVHTLRKALAELEKEGVIMKRKGQVTAVVLKEATFRDYARELISFTEEMHRRGLQPSSRVLRFEKILPNMEVQQALALKPEEEVVVLERIRYGNEKPFNLGVSFLPYKLVPDIFSFDFDRESLHYVLRSFYGIDLVMAEETFEPVMPTPEEARLLDLPPMMPLLLMKGVIYSRDGIPVE
ncbi:MAG: GntR family transcriptional regulator, partial [Atribacterota bacterium]|nr:GntR family transcriptional regulator [Atribacterota bacterium]